MKTVILFSHSYQTGSNTNKAILEVLKTAGNVEIRNLEELYPDGKIDVATEQAALVDADTVVFQHPVFWFSMPPLLKRWMDEVLQYGFAYGTGGDKLHGKKFIHSFTTGTAAEKMTPELLEVMTASIRTSAVFCGMDYQGTVHSFGQLPQTNPNQEADGRNHAQRLLERLARLA